MINKENKNLAINGGNPVSEKPILIHLPFLEDDDIQNVTNVIKTITKD